MTNVQAQGYAVVALNKIISDGYVNVSDKKKTELCRQLDRQMYDLMDIMFEEEAEEKAGRILEGRLG